MRETTGLSTRRELLKAGFGILATFPVVWRARDTQGADFKIIDRLSPKNQRRPARPHTEYIILHTTEGAEIGSFGKVWRRGEAHYFVGTEGNVLRIIDRDKIATHAGRSMWEGHRNIDDYSIGIEVVGFHDKEVSEAQYASLRILLQQLKTTYGISDKRVLTHSMVAYGVPNQFHANDHRGRKRCGMIFAKPDVRAKLGLGAGPDRDRDVDEGRLIIADAELFRYLFPRPSPTAAPVPIAPDTNIVTATLTPWYIARDRYNDANTIYVLPDGKRMRGDQIQDWSRVPEGTKVQVPEGNEDNEQTMAGFLEIGRAGNTPRDLAGEAYNRDTTIYFFPDGLIRTGRELSKSARLRAFLERAPQGTRILVGYVYGGFVRTSRPATAIAGIKWNYPSTYYRFPDGRIVSGDEIDVTAIPAHTLVFYQH
jgi:N-acetylmuramoyl-L-alanine amidase